MYVCTVKSQKQKDGQVYNFQESYYTELQPGFWLFYLDLGFKELHNEEIKRYDKYI